MTGIERAGADAMWRRTSASETALQTGARPIWVGACHWQSGSRNVCGLLLCISKLPFRFQPVIVALRPTTPGRHLKASVQSGSLFQNSNSQRARAKSHSESSGIGMKSEAVRCLPAAQDAVARAVFSASVHHSKSSIIALACASSSARPAFTSPPWKCAQSTAAGMWTDERTGAS